MSTDQSQQPLLVGVDTGGTFTDFALWRDDGLVVHKVLSTPAAPERAIIQGLQDLGIADQPLLLRHGSTVATNAVLEGKGARTVYVTNHGLADVLTIARQNRARLYVLSPLPESPPVPAELCLETGGRMGPKGECIEPLSDQEIQQLLKSIKALDPEAVAINLLFSFVDSRFERRLEQAMPDHLFVSRSSAVLAEIGEYERGIATWLNAFVGPRVARYLGRLATALPRARISVMQSSGLTVSAAQAARHGVNLLLSGPAGGLVGARSLGQLSGHSRLMTLDVGGTSTDVALVDGEVALTREGRIGRFPVAVPMVDMHTIGAGGGSIARVDPQGMLHVGPESAGAAPGPACYGLGGQQPTVTDANLILGRIPPGTSLGNGQPLCLERAGQAMQGIARSLGTDLQSAANGVVRVANELMAGALRVISVQRGHDPQDFTLCCFGGAGGLHACELARLLDMSSVMVPVHAGVLSAVGMLFSPPGREASHSILQPLEDTDRNVLLGRFGELETELTRQLHEEGFASEVVQLSRLIELRYLGQSFALTLPWQDPENLATEFSRCHRQRYGHALDHPVELVSIRVRARGPALVPKARHFGIPKSSDQGCGLDRAQVAKLGGVSGPVSIVDPIGTTWVAAGWRARTDSAGNLLLER
jgi:N-methylhydantoinase A